MISVSYFLILAVPPKFLKGGCDYMFNVYVMINIRKKIVLFSDSEVKRSTFQEECENQNY